MVKIIPNYITEEQKSLILSTIRKKPTKHGKERNSIRRYGSALPYISGVKPTIPSCFDFILAKLREDNIIDSDSVTVNEYKPTQSIDWHIDSLSSGPVIVVLSLLSEATMELRKKETNEYSSILLQPCSLLILDGDERYNWEHSISPVLKHRYSVVFRKGTNVNI